MGIKLSDYLNESNIKLTREQVREALDDYYNDVCSNEESKIESLFEELVNSSLGEKEYRTEINDIDLNSKEAIYISKKCYKQVIYTDENIYKPDTINEVAA